MPMPIHCSNPYPYPMPVPIPIPIYGVCSPYGCRAVAIFFFFRVYIMSASSLSRLQVIVVKADAFDEFLRLVPAFESMLEVDAQALRLMFAHVMHPASKHPVHLTRLHPHTVHLTRVNPQPVHRMP